MQKNIEPGLYLYLIERGDDASQDEVHSFVIAAHHEGQARLIASSGTGDEGAAEWLLTSRSTARLIGAAIGCAPGEVLVREFIPG